MDRFGSEAVFASEAPNTHCHVTNRVSQDKVGSDVRAKEQKWRKNGRAACSDVVSTVNLLTGQDDLIVSNWTVEGIPHRSPLF